MAHDEGIDMVWPGVEPVDPRSCLNLNLLHSAASQPYQECFGQELYPGIHAKAAYLFCHLATSHVFSNGNKRTAVLCLDMFLLANGYFLALLNTAVYALAQDVATAGERGERFETLLCRVTGLLKENTGRMRSLRHSNHPLYRQLRRARRAIRESPLNVPDHPLNQR